MRGIGAAAAALMLAGTMLGTAASTASAAPTEGPRAAASCPTGWGSGAKTGGVAMSGDHLTDIRTGQHECYDRIVFDVPGGGQVGYQVQYVDRFYADPSGEYIPVAGGAILDIGIGAWSVDLDTGKWTYPGKVGKTLPTVNINGYRTFRDTKFGGTSEGQTQVGLGVRARLPFRVIQLEDKVVVDVAHSWTS
ncbi:AMIN-like domain-containing (lipo)protein [Streptomyces graminilatus]|uniref:AMIN-like domain-containing (lipo)protein n=1 Tax=Streptomyces graminilatus TaxID=1464070 RepID=UPI0006E4517E|nr:hypothetical protein [Streptomyces graminilatus]